MHNIADLKIWKKSIELAKMTYQILPDLPKEERFGLSDQIRRSAVSISSNIAEGAGRNSNKEFVYFLGISKGSSYELQTQLVLSYELGMINKEKIDPIIELIVEVQKMIYSFQKKINIDLKVLN